MSDPAQSIYQSGQYDPIIKWGSKVLFGWEGTEGQATDGAPDTMWRIYNGLDKHPDYILLDYVQIADPVRWPMLEFANLHAGRTITDTPSVWVALRETEYTWYPQWGNYSFWLYQNDAVPGGKTVPLWRVGTAPEGRYTRRTDSASGNPSMYFNVDDGYLFDGAYPVTLTVKYLDQGRDSWELQYDSTSGATKSAGVVQKGNTGTWKTISFTLDDARFANRQPGGGKYPGSDFRIWNRDDGDEVIHFAQVIARNRPFPTPRPTRTPTLSPTPTPQPDAHSDGHPQVRLTAGGLPARAGRSGAGRRGVGMGGPALHSARPRHGRVQPQSIPSGSQRPVSRRLLRVAGERPRLRGPFLR